MPDTKIPDTIAAVDLGSNSFHMVIARVIEGQLQVVDRIKETVRLAAGLNADNSLSDEAQGRALDTLSRFGERVRDMEAGSVRAVGTNTLRKARNAKQFIAQIEAALSHPVEIISGLEEARLVYLGVAYDLDVGPERRLVIDIGGGSTEFVIGSGLEAHLRESKYMGCVVYSQRYFPGEVITAQAMDEAVLAAEQEVQSMVAQYKKFGWDVCIGTSGTARAILTILEANGWSRGAITASGLEKLRKRLVKEGAADPLKLAGLSADRAPVLAGGLAILIAAFELLEIKRMRLSEGALREGLMYDLLKRIMHQDIRERTVTNMASRYGVDFDHAGRVENTAIALLDQVRVSWELDEDRFESMLRWAAQLHEIGLAVTHAHYHKHGSYLVENSDMPGFSHEDQQLLWALVRTHRRTFKAYRFNNQPSKLARNGRRQAVLLRLAVLLNRSRRDEAVHDIRIEAEGRAIRMRFPPDWLASRPLTEAALHEEAVMLAEAKFELVIETID
ncbi:MAG: exopolyphosphatase [Bradymonadaceae bacterium]|nr:exopolyphosphatase [Lujinxingiaceae bacterium]